MSNVAILEANAAHRNERVTAIHRILRPRSVAILGISARPESIGRNALKKLRDFGFRGDIYLVGRSGQEAEGLQVHTAVEELPMGIDLAVLALPADAVLDAVKACGERAVGAVLIFASGFAENGASGIALQASIVEAARAANMLVMGPNCVGFINHFDRFMADFVDPVAPPRLNPPGPMVALIGQSGGMLRNIDNSLLARGIESSYFITTGNEADLTTADFIHALADDPATTVVLVYAETIADPVHFLAAIHKLRARGKKLVLLHSGRSVRGREAVQSHTGSLASNFEVMRAHVEHAGAIIADSIESLIDLTELACKFHIPTTVSVGVVSGSGAFCALTIDYCESIGLDLPELSAHTDARLGGILPSFVNRANPLDMSTAPMFNVDLIRQCAIAMCEDELYSSVLFSLPALKALVEPALIGAEASGKPYVVSIWGDSEPLSPALTALLAGHRTPVIRSSERALRALQQFKAVASKEQAAAPAGSTSRRRLAGVVPEWRAKQLLVEAGVRIPVGKLGRSVNEALTIAEEIGYPIALKVQASEISHKSDVGGVALNITDAESLRGRWQTMMDDVGRRAPGVELDGVLIEKMGKQGLELLIGAKRDALWGPTILIGVGGIWVEALGDIRTLSPQLELAEIEQEFMKLKAKKLFDGFRGSPAVDLRAAAQVVAQIGRLMAAHPEVGEIEINPLVVYAAGEGAVALDALIVVP